METLVWVIDDDQGILDVTEIVLTDAGFVVKTIDSEEKLNTELKGKLPKVILLDVMIGGLSGIEVCQRLKSDNNLKQIPVILMSANIDIEKRAEEAQADAYIKKPFDISDLEAIVTKYSA